MTKVVVGYDGTTASEAAVRVALREAALDGAELMVVSSWYLVPYVGTLGGYGYDMALDVPAVREGCREAAVAVVERVGVGLDHRRVPVDVDVVAEGAAHRLLELGADAALVVLGGRRHGPLLSALVGSTTNRVLHHARCPVLVAPADTPLTWERVVVGVDGSPDSLVALRWAAARATAYGCPLVVVQATGSDRGGQSDEAAFGDAVRTEVADHAGPSRSGSWRTAPFLPSWQQPERAPCWSSDRADGTRSRVRCSARSRPRASTTRRVQSRWCPVSPPRGCRGGRSGARRPRSGRPTRSAPGRCRSRRPNRP